MAVECNVDMSLLPPDFCAGSPQEFANAIADALKVTLPSTASTVNTGSNTPTDRNSPWVRYGSNDPKAPDGVWFFQGGFWCMAHPIAPSSPLFQFVYIKRDDVKTYDGGKDGDVTNYSGPMWQIAPELEGRVPVGADGKTDSRFENAKTVGGAEKVALKVSELPQHNHKHWDTMVRESTNDGSSSILRIENVPEAEPCRVAADARGFGIGEKDNNNYTYGAMRPTLAVGDGEEHENMPPFATGCWIKRTARKYYTIAP